MLTRVAIYTVKGLELKGEVLKSLHITHEDEDLFWAKLRITWQWITKDTPAQCFLLHRTAILSQRCIRTIYEPSPSQLICYPPDVIMTILKDNQHCLRIETSPIN